MNPVFFKNCVCGHEKFFNGVHYFFGTAHGSLAILQQIYPKYEFRFLKQVHGSILVESQPTQSLVEADAHWTREAHTALCIRTADCLPVLLGTSDLILAAHAGWRGIENQLIKTCCEFLQTAGLALDQALIGPHIHFADFEVGIEVVQQLKAQFKDLPFPERPHIDSSKRYVDLSALVNEQIQSVFGRAQSNVQIFGKSTFSCPDYFSYRRGPDRQGRQISFVAKNSP